MVFKFLHGSIRIANEGLPKNIPKVDFSTGISPGMSITTKTGRKQKHCLTTWGKTVVGLSPCVEKDTHYARLQSGVGRPWT
jgi:hypothetical protein